MKGMMAKSVFIALMVIMISLVPLTGNAEKEQMSKVTCYVIGNGKQITKENEISLREAEKIIDKVRDAIDAFKVLKGRENSYFTEEERKEVEYILNDLFAALHNAGIVPDEITPSKIGLLPDAGISILHPILSCGSGCSYIPLYPGEAFLGVMLRPIFLQYFLIGYTGCFNVKLVPPRIEYWDWVGTQTIMVFGFVGLYIDFGSIGIGIPPVQVLLGESLFTAGIDWL